MGSLINVQHTGMIEIGSDHLVSVSEKKEVTDFSTKQLSPNTVCRISLCQGEYGCLSLTVATDSRYIELELAS